MMCVAYGTVLADVPQLLNCQGKLADGAERRSTALASPVGHIHDDRYYTKGHMDALEARIADLEVLGYGE